MSKIEIDKQSIDIEKIGHNGNVKIIFSSFKEEFNFNIKIKLKLTDIEKLISTLEPLNNKVIKKETVAYTEDISIYRNDVERVLSITGKKGNLELSLDVYTNNINDDNWILLTPLKLNYFIGLLYGYLE